MGIKRYEVSARQWERIASDASGQVDAIRDVRRADNRLFVNGVLWVLRSGARWSDLPERYGKYQERPQALHPLGSRRACGSGCSRR